MKYSINFKDKDNLSNVNSQVNSSNYKEKNSEGVDSDVESAEDSDHESEITQPEEVSLYKFLYIHNLFISLHQFINFLKIIEKTIEFPQKNIS